MKHDSLQSLLAARFAAAIAQVAGTPAERVDPQVRPAGDPQFGDYQCNAAMALARPLKSKPRDLAQRIKDAVTPALADIAEPLEIAGPGFINVRLKAEFLARYLGEIPRPTRDVASAPRGRRDEPMSGTEAGRCAGPSLPLGLRFEDRVGLPPAEGPRRVVVEYSQPNIAKQMHVGHLRSTIIGDVLARVLAFQGHEVIRQNHIGDWGTQMGAVMLGLWYIRTRLRRGDSIEGVRELHERLKGLTGAAVEARRAALAPICAEWSQDLQDRSLDDLSGVGVTLDELELGYVFVQTLMTVAKRTGATVTSREGQPELLEDVPRKVTLMLQSGHEYERREWEAARDISLRYCQDLYDRLGVLLTPADVRGESFYNDRLPRVIEELRERFGAERDQGIKGSRDQGAGRSHLTTSPPSHTVRAEVRDDRGAVVLYLYDEQGQPLFKNPDGEVLGMIVQKSDGAYLYATTDLAAIRFRLLELDFPSGGVGAERVIYVTDARQKLHFRMFFACARAAGWITDAVQVEHVTFGSVLGADRTPLKTRAGGTIKLRDLLKEAETRALELLEKRDQGSEGSRDQGEERQGAQLADDEKLAIAQRVGIAAVKYADLRNDRNADYVFDWDRMLALQGNTAPYMMYAYARIRSIYRKAAERFGAPDVYAPGVKLALNHPTERALALRLARLREAIDAVAAELTPHVLCTYLYDLAGEFMRFYESCPVLAAKDEATRLGRMRLCDLTARTLKLGLGLLGIEVIERM